MPIIGNNGTPSIFDPQHIPLAQDHLQKLHGMSCEDVMHKSELAVLSSIDIIEAVSERSGKVSNLNPQDAKDKFWYEHPSISTSSKSNSPEPSELQEAPKLQELEPAYTEPANTEPPKMHETCDTDCVSPVILTKELLQDLDRQKPLLRLTPLTTQLYSKFKTAYSALPTPTPHICGGPSMQNPLMFEEPSSAQVTPL